MTGPNLIYEVGPENLGGLIPTGYGDYSTNPTAISKRASRQAKMVTHTYRLPAVVKLGLSYNLFTSEKTNWLVSGEIWRNSNLRSIVPATMKILRLRLLFANFTISPYYVARKDAPVFGSRSGDLFQNKEAV